MKAPGRRILGMVKLLSDTQTAIATMATLRWEKLMEKVFILGHMEKFTMVSGFKALSKAMEFGEDFITTRILVNGLSQKLMAMVFIHGRMVIVMKASGICV
jgi:hypothetical protein